MTGTFKYSKTELVRQGYDPLASRRTSLFRSSQKQAASFRSTKICTMRFRAARYGL